MPRTQTIREVKRAEIWRGGISAPPAPKFVPFSKKRPGFSFVRATCQLVKESGVALYALLTRKEER